MNPPCQRSAILHRTTERLSLPTAPVQRPPTASSYAENRRLRSPRRSSGPLPEQDGLCCLVLAEIAFAGIGHRHREATLHPGPRQHGIEPAFEMRELVPILSEAHILLGPTDASHVGDRIIPGKILAMGQTFVLDPEQSVHLIGIAVDAASHLFGCIVAEVISLSCHRAEPAHLPTATDRHRPAGAHRWHRICRS